MNIDFDVYDADPEGIDIASWSPTPQAAVDAGKPQAPSTQVHLFMPLPGKLGKMLMRFKSPRTLDRLISALIRHRMDVWGPPSRAVVEGTHE